MKNVEKSFGSQVYNSQSNLRPRNLRTERETKGGEMSLAKKLAEVMAAVDHVAKRGRNESQQYSYVKAADVANAVREELSKRQIVLLPTATEERHYEITTAKGNKMQAVDAKIWYTFIDGESDEKIDVIGLGSGFDSGDKAIYKAQTGCLKYALRSAFLIPDEADPEADESVDHETRPKPSLGRPPNAIRKPQTNATARPAVQPQAKAATASAFVSTPAESTSSHAQPPQAVSAGEGGKPAETPVLDVLPAEDGVLPTKEETPALHARVKAIAAKLKAAGLPINPIKTETSQVVRYLKQLSEVDDLKDITRAQWNTHLAEMENSEIATVLEQVQKLNTKK